MLSRTGQYAVKAAIYLAGRPAGSFHLAREIGRELKIPEQYLSKVLHQMARCGLLESQRGRQGGFRLRIAAGRLTLFEVLDAVEDTHRFERCLLGPCSEKAPCPVHERWKKIREDYLELLRKTTVSDLLDERKK